MIKKWYEVICDGCNNLIDYYTYKPTPTQLRKEGCKVKINNGKIKVFCCDECYNKTISKTN